MNKRILSILVENTAGVLSRVQGCSVVGVIILTAYRQELPQTPIIPV